MTRQVTIALPLCETHPAYSEWSLADLARGICPKCGCHIGNDPKAAREIRARYLAMERDSVKEIEE